MVDLLVVEGFRVVVVFLVVVRFVVVVRRVVVVVRGVRRVVVLGVVLLVVRFDVTSAPLPGK